MNTDDLIQELRDGLEGVTPGPWKPMCLPYDGYDDPFILGGGEIFVCQTVYDMQSTTTVHDVDADTRHIARCSPDNIRTLLDSIASKDTALAEKEEQRASADRAAGQRFEKLVEANESLAEIRAEYLNASHDAMKLAAELALVKKALEEATEPNLFWDNDNPEESFTTIEDLVDYIGTHSIAMRVRLAKSLPDRWVSAVQGKDQWIITYHNNHDDAFAEMNRASRALSQEEGR